MELDVIFWRGFLIGVLFGMLACLVLVVVVAWTAGGLGVLYYGVW